MGEDRAIWLVAIWVFLGLVVFSMAQSRLEDCPTGTASNEEGGAQNKSAGSESKSNSNRETATFSQNLKERISASQQATKPGQKFCEFKLNDLIVALLAYLTIGVGLLQIYYLHGTLEATSTNARAAKDSADAAVKAAMPILFPFVIDGTKLLPRGGEDKQYFHPKLSFMFENYGKTPAVIISLKFELLVNSGELPEEPPWTHPIRLDERDVIRGETKYGDDGVSKVLHYTFYRALTDDELFGITMNPTPEWPTPHRYWFYGQVVYDDVFGYQHIKGFVRKVFPADSGLPSQRVKHAPKYEYYRRINRKTGKEE
jgi:hypothetical protein